VFGVTWNTPTQNEKGSKILLLHRTCLSVHPEQTSCRGIINNGVSQTFTKLCPSSLHHLFPSHENDLSLIGLVEVNGGIELSHNVLIERAFP
jgi:hypothetical protein